MWQSRPESTLITAPSVEPITLAEAKLYLRVDSSADNSLITGFITSARQMVETYTRRSLCTQTYDFKYARFMDIRRPLIVPRALLQSVTHIKYLDEDASLQTLSSADYTVRVFAGATAGRGYIELNESVSLPSLDTESIMPVIVRAVCGYGAAADVPEGLKSALYLLLGDLYEQRQETMQSVSNRTQTTAARLMSPYRLLEVS